MCPEHVAENFVTHATVLLAANLAAELDPVLAAFLPERVPEADDLLDDQMLLSQVIRAPRGDLRVEGALQWFESVWFELEDRPGCDACVREVLDRLRYLPAIPDLEDALRDAADLLETLASQTGPFRDVSGLNSVLAAVRRWQEYPDRDRLLDLERCCRDVDEPSGLPSAEMVRRIRFFAHHGSLLAADYLALHFSVDELRDWPPAELTAVLRARYPLLRVSDVIEIVRRLDHGQPTTAVA